MIEAFRIAVHLGLTSNASQMLDVLGNKFLGLNKHILTAGKNFSALKAAMAGGLAIGVGVGAGKLLWDVAEAGKKLRSEQLNLKMTDRSLTSEQLDAATKTAWATSQAVPGTVVSENTAAIRELNSVLGSKQFSATLELTPDFIASKRAIEMLTHEQSPEMVQTFIKILEQRGHISSTGEIVDPAKAREELADLFGMISASQGMIKPQQVLAAVQMAGPAATMMAPEAFYGQFGAAMVAMGASKAGNAFMSLYQQMVGHVIAGKRIAVAMEETGLLKHGSWKVEKGGKVIMDKDAVVEQDKFASHPMDWIHDVLKPNLERMVASGHGDKAAARLQEIFQISSRATSARLVNDIVNNWPAFENEAQRWKNAPTAAAVVKEFTDNDMQAGIDRLQASWQNFMTSFSGPAVDIVVKTMNKISDALDYLQKKSIEHPEAAEILTKLAVGITAVGVAVGILAAGAGLAALLTLGGPLGAIALVGVATVAACAGLEQLQYWIEHLLPNWFQGSKVVGQMKDAKDAESTGLVLGSKEHPYNSVPWYFFLPQPSGSIREDPPWMSPDARSRARNAPVPEGAGGRVIPQSYHPPTPDSSRPVVIQNITYLDGKVVAESVNKYNGNRANRTDLRSTTGYDRRLGLGVAV